MASICESEYARDMYRKESTISSEDLENRKHLNSINNIQRDISDALKKQKEIHDAKGIMGRTADDIPDTYGKVKDNVSSNVSQVTDLLSNTGKEIKDKTSDTYGKVKDNVSDNFDRFKNWIYPPLKPTETPPVVPPDNNNKLIVAGLGTGIGAAAAGLGYWAYKKKKARDEAKSILN